MMPISNYKELVAERIRLEAALRNQKADLKSEIESIKQKLKPVGDVIALLGIFKRKDAPVSSILKTGASLGIDWLVRDKLLSRAGWITRAVLPMILKNISNLWIRKKTGSTADDKN
jgi:hypothetical protein